MILVVLIGGVEYPSLWCIKYTEASLMQRNFLSSGRVMYDDQGQVLYTYGSEENGTRENITYEDFHKFLLMLLLSSRQILVSLNHNGFDLPKYVLKQLCSI